MDDRTARGREPENPQPPSASSPGPDQSARKGRVGGADPALDDRRSSAPKPALTERERDEPWPLG